MFQAMIISQESGWYLYKAVSWSDCFDMTEMTEIGLLLVGAILHIFPTTFE